MPMTRFARSMPILLCLAVGAATVTRAADDERSGTVRTATVRLGRSVGRRVPELLFGVNCEFFRPGLAAGVTTQRAEFAAALRGSGIRVLRFPGGNAAYYYLPESREATLRLAHACGHWEFRESAPPNNRFVQLRDLAEFAKSAGVRLIYQLPCLFYFDGQTGRAVIRSKLSDRAGNYDHDRIREGVAYGVSIAQRLLRWGASVAMWEIGNEEFALCRPEDYARVVTEYVQGLRKIDLRTPIVVVGMGKDWSPRLIPLLRSAGVLDGIAAFQAHYPFGAWPGPRGEAHRADPARFATGDLRIDRFLDKRRESLAGLQVANVSTAITETTAMHFRFWDPAAIVPTLAHALCYAWNWLTFLERRDVTAAVFHDLETPFFGMLRYDVEFSRSKRRFVWLEAVDEGKEALDPRFPRRYVLSPTSIANRMLSELAAEDLVETGISPTHTLRLLASGSRLVVVNRGSAPVLLRAPFPLGTGEALTGRSLGACLPDEFGCVPVKRTEADETSGLFEVPPFSVAVIRR